MKRWLIHSNVIKLWFCHLIGIKQWYCHLIGIKQCYCHLTGVKLWYCHLISIKQYYCHLIGIKEQYCHLIGVKLGIKEQYCHLIGVKLWYWHLIGINLSYCHMLLASWYVTSNVTSIFLSFYNHWMDSILKLIRPSPSNVFNCNSHKGVRFITWLRVWMSHLHEHKFKHNFQDCLNSICSCGLDIKSTWHFLLHCPTFNDERYTLLSTLNNIDCAHYLN